MFNMIKKADIVLFVVLLLGGIALSLLSAAGNSAGGQVEITANGEPYGTYSLSKNQTIEIKQNGHINKITIKDNTVQMSYSDCKNQVCVKDGRISRTNQSIVCLPNRIVIRITGGEEEYDAISN